MMWEKLKSLMNISGSDDKIYADFYNDYLHHFRKLDTKTSLQHQAFVVLDTETTGLDIHHDSILSIGAVRVVNNSIDIADSLSLIVKNEQTQTQESVAIHGIVQTQLKGTQPLDAIAALFQFVGSDVLVGHHIAFDIAMLNKLSKKHGGNNLKNNIIDTSYLARRIDHATDPDSLDRKDYTLDKLCTRYKVIPKARHTADGDAYITAIIFMKLLQRLSFKGVTSIGQLLK